MLMRFSFIFTNDRHTFTEFAGLPILQLTTVGVETGRLRTSL